MHTHTHTCTCTSTLARLSWFQGKGKRTLSQNLTLMSCAGDTGSCGPSNTSPPTPQLPLLEPYNKGQVWTVRPTEAEP